MVSSAAECGQVADHLIALDAAVEGLLRGSLNGLSDDVAVEVLQGLETVPRKASAVGNRLDVESVERSLPGNLAFRSNENFLIRTHRRKPPSLREIRLTA